MSTPDVLSLSAGSPKALDFEVAPSPPLSPPARTNAALPGEDEQRAIAVLPGSPEIAALADAYLDVLPVRERSGDGRLAVRLPTPPLPTPLPAGEGALPPVVVTRSRSGGPAIPPAVLANWADDIAFLSSGDAEEVTRGLGNFMRSNNKERSGDPGIYLTSVRDDAFVGPDYGRDMALSLGTKLDDILGREKQKPVLIESLDPAQRDALVEMARKLVVDRLLNPEDAASVFRRAGGDYLKVSSQYARMIAAERGDPADVNRALTTLYINNFFLRGACSALNHAAVDRDRGDRRLVVVAALVQRLVNGADSPHATVEIGTYAQHRDDVQRELRAALENAGVPFVS